MLENMHDQRHRGLLMDEEGQKTVAVTAEFSEKTRRLGQ